MINVDLFEEELEDTIGVTIIRKSKDRQHNGQRKKYKPTNNDLQNIAHKTKDDIVEILLKLALNTNKSINQIN
jgi:hypothetical protein